MLCAAMDVEFLGKRTDAGAGDGNESRHGQRGKYNEEEEQPYGLLDRAYKGKRGYVCTSRWMDLIGTNRVSLGKVKCLKDSNTRAADRYILFMRKDTATHYSARISVTW